MKDLVSESAYPILPLRDIVVFPNMIVPLFVGRSKSIKALEYSEKNQKEILLVSQKDANIDDPEKKDIFKIGTIATVLQLLKLPDGTVKVLVEGIERSEITEFKNNKDFFECYTTNLIEKKLIKTKKLMP
jgi:ATP-dependent Lon protease